jgi:hypothetical protein
METLTDINTVTLKLINSDEEPFYLDPSLSHEELKDML